LCIMGGEPLCPENEFLTNLVITEIKKIYPNIKIYVWTGYVYDDLKNSNNIRIKNILKTADYLIDGPYIQKERDITLPLRGSRNQHIINLKLDKEENL
ncbi:MAG: 4Fe-4S cluster-binding domain-containing protein, partial [Clostridiales bacterium]|nr:4Fe-4S cluster-binding domain-containing protein [Clostridiales bacterium]